MIFFQLFISFLYQFNFNPILLSVLYCLTTLVFKPFFSFLHFFFSCSSTCREKGVSLSPERGSMQLKSRARSATFTLWTLSTGSKRWLSLCRSFSEFSLWPSGSFLSPQGSEARKYSFRFSGKLAETLTFLSVRLVLAFMGFCVQGHVVLTDFGLCKEGVEPEGTTTTFCGTPEVTPHSWKTHINRPNSC